MDIPTPFTTNLRIYLTNQLYHQLLRDYQLMLLRSRIVILRQLIFRGYHVVNILEIRIFNVRPMTL